MIGHLLLSEVTLYRPSFAADGRGGRTTTMASQGTLRAKIDQPTDTERLIAAQRGAELTHVVHLAHGSGVQRGDELDNGGARRLRVVAVVTDSHGTYDRLDCEVMQGA